MVRPKKRQLNPGHHVPAEFVAHASVVDPDDVGDINNEIPLTEDEYREALALEHDTALPLVEAAALEHDLVRVKILRETWDSNENRLAVGSIVSVSKADFEAMDAKGFVERV